MGDKTRIEWADATWNPIRGTAGNWHCTKVSEACEHCYAESMNVRFGGPKYTVGADSFRLFESVLEQPSRWRRPRRIFVCSMTDLFHEDIPFEWIKKVFGEMLVNRHHTFLVLTKRPEIMRSFILYQKIFDGPPPPNIWLGVTAENQNRANERIPLLMNTPAVVRWVSCEPLLGPVGLFPIIATDIESGLSVDESGKLNWIVVGGESGSGSRPMHPNWVRKIRDKCEEFGCAFFFKQWGDWACWDFHSWNPNEYRQHVFDDGVSMYRVGKKTAGRLLDGVEWNEYPQPQEVMP